MTRALGRYSVGVSYRRSWAWLTCTTWAAPRAKPGGGLSEANLCAQWVTCVQELCEPWCNAALAR